MDGIEEKSVFDWQRWLAISLVVLVGLALVGGGIFVYKKALSKKETPSVAFQPTPTLEALPTEEIPTPTSNLVRAELKIKVLNGTGVVGAAGKAAQFLENLGYQDVKTSNADRFDYQKTMIQIKEEKREFLELLKKDLSTKFVLGEEIKTLPEEESFDVIIILGKS